MLLSFYLDTTLCHKSAHFWFQQSLILFGGICQGVVSNETWIFNTVSSQWTLLEISNLVEKPLGVTGHTATVVGHDMIVLFGYNPELGFVNKIQVFSLGKQLL